MKMIKFILLFFLISCSGLRHWKEVATDDNVTPQKKAILAPKAALLYPSETKYLPGTVTVTTDTIVDIEAIIEMGATIDSLLWFIDTCSSNSDSLRRAILSRFKPTRTRTIETRIDTVYMPSIDLSSTLYATQYDLATCETENARLNSKNSALEEKVKEWYEDKWFWWFIGVSVALILSVILHFKR